MFAGSLKASNTHNSLDKVEHRNTVADRAEQCITIRRKDHVTALKDGPAQMRKLIEEQTSHAYRTCDSITNLVVEHWSKLP